MQRRTCSAIGRKIAAGFLDQDVVDRDVVGAGIDEQLGREGVILRRAETPFAAVNGEENRRLRALRLVEIKLLADALAVGMPLRLTEAGSRLFAERGQTLRDLGY
jgi:hypothetical protein